MLNSAARLLSGLKRFDHITPALVDLHWFPYPQRITYRLCMITFKCLRGFAPAYLADYCTSTSFVLFIIIINEIFVMRLSKTNAAKAHCS